MTRNDASPRERALEGVLALILQERIPAGQALPPERELCEQLGVSRTSLRGALGALGELRVLDGKWGSGNYVLPHPPELVLQRDEGFNVSICKAGMKPSYQVLSAAVEAVGPAVAARLEILEGDDAYRFRRLVMADGNPVCLQDSWLSLVRCPGLERYDYATTSLYRVLEEDYGIVAHHNVAKVSVEHVSAEEAGLLAVEEGMPTLCVEGTNRDDGLVPVECYREVFVPGRMAIVSDTTVDDFFG